MKKGIQLFVPGLMLFHFKQVTNFFKLFPDEVKHGKRIKNEVK